MTPSSSNTVINLIIYLSTYSIIIIQAKPVLKNREEKGIFLMPMIPSSAVPSSNSFSGVNPHHQLNQEILLNNQNQPQIRGPFDFIGQWIQQTPFLPIQINVPDIFQNIGNGINQATNNMQQISQNVGSGVSQFTQNLGSGVTQFGQNVGNGFNQWISQLGQRVPILGNFINRFPNTGPGNNQPHQLVVMVPLKYPGGQELVLEEALEAFP